MARFKVTPVNIKNGNEAPFSIHDFDENKDPEAQAEAVCYLTKRYPNTWRPSVSKLQPCKIDMQRARR